jgi:hypothetical protein
MTLAPLRLATHRWPYSSRENGTILNRERQMRALKTSVHTEIGAVKALSRVE